MNAGGLRVYRGLGLDFHDLIFVRDSRWKICGCESGWVFCTKIGLVGEWLTSSETGGLWLWGRLCLLGCVLVLGGLKDKREEVACGMGVERPRL